MGKTNPLMLPSIGNTGDLGDAQTPVHGVPGGHHTLTCLGVGLQKVVTPQPAQGSSSPRGPRRSSRLDLPRDPILGRPSRLDLPGDLHPDPGMPGSQVATVLGRMNLHHIYSRPQWAKQTSYFYPALVTLEILGTPKLQSGGVPGGHHTLTCLGIGL